MRLVVNADDLGLHPAIDEGILRAHREGILTSASVLVMGSSAQEAVRRAREQKLALGVHLCLSTRLPPAAECVPSVAPGGRLRASWAELVRDFVLGRVRTGEVAREWQAQVQRAHDLGFKPDHLDGHQHLHLLPGLTKIVRALAEQTRLPVRWPKERPRAGWLGNPGALARSTVLCALANLPGRAPWRALPAVGVFESGALDEAALLRLLETLRGGDRELLCHPGGRADLAVPEQPGWRYGWTTELQALCSPKVRETIRRRGISLTTYGALFAT